MAPVPMCVVHLVLNIQAGGGADPGLGTGFIKNWRDRGLPLEFVGKTPVKC